MACISRLLVLLAGAALLPAAPAAEKAALILDPNDPGSDLVAEAFDAARIKTADVGSLLEKDELLLARFDVLCLGPRATNDRAVTDWMRRNAAGLRAFVAEGGCVIVFDQSPDFWDIEPWLPRACFLLRGREPPGKGVAAAGEDHPLFGGPYTLPPESLTGDANGLGGDCCAFRQARGFRVLAEGAGGRSWCVETGWGSGRVLVLAWNPRPPAAGEGQEPPPAALETARRFLDNIAAYSIEAARGEAPALPPDLPAIDWSETAHLDPALFTPESEKALDLAINAAVDRGAAYLIGQQREDGSWDEFGASNGTYRAGPPAIALLALLASGVSKHKDCIVAGFDWLLDNPPEMTYEIGLSMMAMEEKAAPMFERFEIQRLPPEERRSFQFVRNLSDEERRFMEYCRDRLVAHWVRGGTWRYRSGVGDGDISNGQYALLGLKAASRCGLEVKAEVWEKALDYFLTYQQSSGPKVAVPRFRRFEEDFTPKFYAERAEARGWQYLFGHPGEVLGTHACIGVASAIICYEELSKHPRGKGGGASAAKVREAVRDGTAWLYRNWSVDHVPGGEKFYFYYYIYSLERVGVLTQSRFIGDRDWYREGAEYLLAKQQDDGSWHSRSGEWGTPIANTAFALLFLKRSTPPPVITIGK